MNKKKKTSKFNTIGNKQFQKKIDPKKEDWWNMSLLEENSNQEQNPYYLS